MGYRLFENFPTRFLDGNGDPLAAGTVTFYLAGTTTNAAIYTDNNGTAASNPQTLDANGQFSTAIWGDEALSYKIVVKDSTGSQIGPTHDNVSFSAVTAAYAVTTVENQLGSDASGQVFTLANAYTPGNSNTWVFQNGQKLISGVDYTETDANTVTVDSSVTINSGDRWQFVINTGTATPATSAANTSYTPAGSGAEATNVQAKLREFVSVKDFGAVGNGVDDDTSAIQAALTAGDTVYAPAGTYKITSGLVIPTGGRFVGDGVGQTIIAAAISSGIAISVGGAATSTSSSSVEKMSLTNVGGSTTGTVGVQVLDNTRYGVYVKNMQIGDFSQLHFGTGLKVGKNCYNADLSHVEVFGNVASLYVDTGNNLASFTNCWFKSDSSAGTSVGTVAGTSTAADQTFNLTFIGCGFEAHDSGLAIGSASNAVNDVSFISCYFEGNNDHHILATTVRGLNISGGYFQMNNVMTTGVSYVASWGVVSSAMCNNVAAGGYFLKADASSRVYNLNTQDLQGTAREVDPSATVELTGKSGVFTASSKFKATSLEAGTDMSITGSTVGRAGTYLTFNSDNNIDVNCPTNRKFRIQGELGVYGTSANTNTPSGATAYQWPLYDESGSLLGYIPVYGSAW
jgi:hypothetical protein